MKDHVGHLATDCTHIDHQDPDHGTPIAPIMVDGVMYLPAHEMNFASLSAEQGGVAPNGKAFGMMLVRLGGMGMNVAMTAATMREYARQMLAVAQEIEDGAATMAAAAIAAAGKPRT